MKNEGQIIRYCLCVFNFRKGSYGSIFRQIIIGFVYKKDDKKDKKHMGKCCVLDFVKVFFNDKPAKFAHYILSNYFA